MTAKILAFSGSARRDSFNQKLVAHSAKVAQQGGAQVTLISLADFSMPLYDQDLEGREGLPKNAVKLRDLFMAHDALLLACPEYNGSITPLLKNTIDWISRPSEGVKPMAAYAGKVAGLLSASPGGLGGMRGLVHVRAILSGIGVLVVPGDVSVGGAHAAFSSEGSLVDDKMTARVDALVNNLVTTTDALMKTS